jgi:predicted nucleic acid-binding protein
VKEIADTGVIVALLTRNDPHHAWALQAFRNAPKLDQSPISNLLPLAPAGKIL